MMAPATSAWRPALQAGTLLLMAGALTVQGLAARLPPAEWLRVFWSPNAAAMPEMVVHYSWLPRLLTAWICGAALALSGTIFQQILRNPLASPTTLGVSVMGALIMVAADWLGRTILFLRQVPAGLIATLIGAPYFMWRMRRA